MPQELKPAKLIQCLGKSINDQKIFKIQNIIPTPETDIENHLYLNLHLSLKDTKGLLLFGIPVEQVHFAVDSQQHIKAIFIKVINDDLVDKLNKLAGQFEVAGGVSLEANMPFSEYQWRYKNSCIDLSLEAYEMQLVPRIVRDTGLIVFYNCKLSSYSWVPEGYDL